MPNTQRMVAVVVAVADAKPLKFLHGALNGARDFALWASAQGYETTLVTDEDEAVTVMRLKKELDKVLCTAAATPIERLALYFAGHGLMQETGEGLWLVSDWSSDGRCIHVGLLKRRLFTYHVGQVAVFSDACRLLPTNYKTAELSQDSLIGWGPRLKGPGDPTIPVDTFAAAQDYAAAFAVPGSTPEEDRCIFTGVLMPGLWGVKPSAFSKVQKDRVVSRSLGLYLENEVAEVAKKYMLALRPTIAPLFPELQDVYYLTGTGRVAPPVFPDWPPADKVLPQGPAPNKSTAGDAGSPAAAPAGTTDIMVDIGTAGTSGLGAGSGAGFRAPQKMRQAPKSLKSKLQDPLLADFAVRCGFAISGDQVRRIWAPSHVHVEACDQPGRFKLHSGKGGTLEEPAPLLLELGDGDTIAAVTALPNFVASLVCDRRGLSALVYRNFHMWQGTVLPSVDALMRMERGGLRWIDSIDLAVKLRQGKHADPMLGVISAYLYDSIGDVDSTRRMASAYVYHSQPIPYDIALLAQLQGTMKNGVYWVDVPAVGARPPRTDQEKKYSWAYEATPARQGPVGGVWPWMSQGWLFLDDPSDLGSTLIHHGLRDMLGNLLRGRFASVDLAGATKLAGMFTLVERSPPQGPDVPRSPASSPMTPAPAMG